MLEQIHSHADMQSMSVSQLNALCQELRAFLLDSVSKTGGHLASNLGTVELTVAIHHVFDTARDRLVFDVGHQCYVHKALTGRWDRFGTLRQIDGLAGFPKPSESIHDAFVAGHASNSVSVALGMARARSLQGEDYSVLALIGDGALTGGLSYEGLNDAGASNEPLIVILNDNGMSINPNVGGVSSHLAYIRTRASYYNFKKHYRLFLSRLPGGKRVYRFNHKIKTTLKKLFFPCTMFEDMGFTYLGPVDGHNVGQLIHTLRWARELNCPVLIHVKTKKGKGYPPAEHTPDRYHGVGPFDKEQGIPPGNKRDFSAVFGETMEQLAVKSEKVCAITAAMAEGTGLEQFARFYPNRFFDVGIAEGHAVSMAGGMAKQGMIPVFAVYSSFLQRSYDMLIHDVALQNLHVVLAVDRAGLVGADGATHHGVADVSFLTHIPNMTVLAPSSFRELQEMLEQGALYTEGPVAVRYPRGAEGHYTDGWNQRDDAVLSRGDDVTIVSYGILINEVLAAAELLRKTGLTADVVKLNTLAPLSVESVAESVSRTGRLVVVEDCFPTGSVGQQLLAALASRGISPGAVRLCSTGDRFIAQGSVEQLRSRLGIDGKGIAETVQEVCRG